MDLKESLSYTINNIRDFDPVHTFECGQCFRWERQEDGSYTGAAMGRIVNIRYDADGSGAAAPAPAGNAEDFDAGAEVPARSGSLTITPCTEEEYSRIWRQYLDLDRDYGAIKRKLSQNDDIMKSACEYGYGIRILKQDLWETIVSFIISQNNNIPRIKGCIERLCENFGEPITENGDQDLSPICTPPGRVKCIPSPEVLAALTVDDLAPVRLGYRAKYLVETAKTVCEKGLPKDFDGLSALCGVGPKVASCIALFGMQDYASFPIDVWVMKVMHDLYGLPEGNKKAMSEFARDHFGELGGFAQQYLFYYMRDRS